jgi:ABC-type amino acid transport system permease subunit
MNVISNEPSTWEEEWKIITDDGKLTAQLILRGIWSTIKFKLISILLGIVFFLMAMAIRIGVFRIFPYWQPAYLVMMRWMGATNAPPKLIPMKLRCLLLPTVAFAILASAFLFYVGLRSLIFNGFCAQNLICQAIYK